MTVLPDPPEPPAPKSRVTRKRVLKWFLITLGVGTVAFIGLVIFALIQLEGGWPWAFTNAPVKTDRNVVEANAAGDTVRNQLMADLQKAGSAADLKRVTATSPKLDCRTGQHNWKINNDYDLECTSTVTLVLGAELPTESFGSPAVKDTRTVFSEDTLRARLKLFHDQLLIHGWKSHDSGSYGSSGNYGNSIPNIFVRPPRGRASASPGTQGTPPSSLPFPYDSRAASYFRDAQEGNGSASLSIHFGSGPMDYAVSGLEPYPTATDQSAQSVYDAIRAFIADGKHYVANVQLTYTTFRE